MNSPMDRGNNWSEGRGITEDVMHNLGTGGEVDSAITDMPVKRGVILLADCNRCGRQNKSLVEWAEVATWEIKRNNPDKWDPRYEQPTRQGLMTQLRCNGSSCQKPFTVLVEWDELRRWLDLGVQTGCLNAKIYDVSRRRR